MAVGKNYIFIEDHPPHATAEAADVSLSAFHAASIVTRLYVILYAKREARRS
jgi:hypothetical protein